MTPPKVSIVMTAYQRAPLLHMTLASIAAQRVPEVEVIVVEDGDDGGATRQVCHSWGVRYLQRVSRPPVAYSNQAVVINKGLRHATGDVVILQNAECYHQGAVVEALVASVTPTTAVYAACQALNADGTFQQWYCHPLHNPRPFFFCGAMTRENFVRLGGFEETFTAYGFEDDDMVERMRMAGISHMFSDATVLHQWHPPFSGVLDSSHFDKVRRERTTCVANVGREWGVTP